MSCYIVSEKHIQTIVAGAVAFQLFYEVIYGMTPDQLGAMLWKANSDSVNDRYKGGMPDPEFKFDSSTKPPTADEMYGLLQCLEYQSCDAEGYRSSKPYTAICYLGFGLGKFLMGEARYEAAPWDL